MNAENDISSVCLCQKWQSSEEYLVSRFMVADSTFRIGYHTCETTCSETHRQHGPQSVPHLRVMSNEKEPVPQLCHYREDAPYVTVCSANATICVDGVVQLNENLCVNCKLCGIAYPFGAIKFSGSRPLNVPTNTNTLKAPPVPPAPARINILLDWVPGIRAIVVKCNLCSFDEQGPVCMRICPTKALRLVDNIGIVRANKRKRELIFNTDFGDFTLFQQAQSGEAK